MIAIERRFELPGSVSGSAVRGLVALPDGDGPFPFVVFVHGYTVSCEWGFYPELSRRLAEHGIASVRFVFSGDGIGADLRTVVDLDAVARNGYTDELADLAGVRAFADAQPELDAERAAVLGHSRGGGMALVHAAEDGAYRTVVGWAPMDSILRFSPERLDQWRRNGEVFVRHHTLDRRVRLCRSVLEDAERNLDRLDIVAQCGRLRCPILVVNGGRDPGLPPASGQRLIAACPMPGSCQVTIEDAGHTFGARDPLPDPMPPRLERLLSVTVEWLDQSIATRM